MDFTFQLTDLSYNGNPVGAYTAELLAEDPLIVELKAVKPLDEPRTA